LIYPCEKGHKEKEDGEELRGQSFGPGQSVLRISMLALDLYALRGEVIYQREEKKKTKKGVM